MSKMIRLILIVFVLSLVLMISGAVYAADEGQATNTNVSMMTPFTREANFMSPQGYLRWQMFLENGVWIPPLLAVRAVKSQGAVPTLDCHTAKILNGCIPIE